MMGVTHGWKSFIKQRNRRSDCHRSCAFPSAGCPPCSNRAGFIARGRRRWRMWRYYFIAKSKNRLCCSELPSRILGRKSSSGLWDMFSSNMSDDGGLSKLHFWAAYMLEILNRRFISSGSERKSCVFPVVFQVQVISDCPLCSHKCTHMQHGS